jgi:hypothetical protein
MNFEQSHNTDKIEKPQTSPSLAERIKSLSQKLLLGGGAVAATLLLNGPVKAQEIQQYDIFQGEGLANTTLNTPQETGFKNTENPMVNLNRLREQRVFKSIVLPDRMVKLITSVGPRPVVIIEINEQNQVYVRPVEGAINDIQYPDLQKIIADEYIEFAKTTARLSGDYQQKIEGGKVVTIIIKNNSLESPQASPTTNTTNLW